ncbi:calcium/sodium antiporter [Natronobacterium gregoryi]|uniref:CaCA family Na+/Ca+ antiporter n=2 Tax=Natronobacterium gregoryi TaxID=44930 RepID=L0AE55_NATGS|nr:calcium/sodium antiporter [Natronobacterium gregoryi]AFZ72183.1 K+dependent Na+ exchanger related-protein [Natronobacterium gregoryi SP2]ELY63042.1 CaCA family Na+/Ca+ antiporter [Natronobacterium gregoryi SP2]PLK20127.1 cation transporter [Natronobacterium gregoryi SP2]SFJ32601.1 cation:H+ antiporter [Natronobacterium gregoryi]
MLSETGVFVVLLGAGVIALYVGAELLVAGAGRLALGLGLRAATVGVTVIAFATTAPELFVATIGALDVSTDVGLGAIIGSNIANVGLVLGVTALIKPLAVSERVLRRHVPTMVVAALLLLAFAANGRIGRLEGVLFLLALAGFTACLLYYAGVDQPPVTDAPDAGTGATARDVALVGGGLIALVVGSRWLVSGGTGLLSALGFSDLFIGLTVLALGTSLPELAASVVGALRGETAFAIGNVVGSNIYNVLAVLGIVAVITPIEVATSTLRFELPALVVFTLVLTAMMGYGRGLSRVDGAVLVAGYGAFVYLLFP